MGSIVSTPQFGISLSEITGPSYATNCLRVDEKWPNLGSAATPHSRLACQSPATGIGRQQNLLAQLIGGDLKSADAMSAQLIQAFGSLGQVISASSAALSRVVNDPQLVSRITAVKSVAMEGLTEQLQRFQFDLEDTTVQRWVIGLFNGLRIERVHMAMLDSRMRLLGDEKIVDGSFGNVSLCLRKIVTRGLDTGATSLILMHNHPSGDPRPSDADIQETRKIRFLLANLDMRLDDHLIVAGHKIHSMMRGGTCG